MINEMTTITIDSIKKEIESERSLGEAFFFFNYEHQKCFVIETEEELEEGINRYNKQGYDHIKNIIVNKDVCKTFGIKKAELIVLKCEFLFNQRPLDPLSLFFGYLKANNEQIFIKITY